MDVKEQILNLKAAFRQGMNGVASAQMRKQGLVYKLNFGIELPRLYEIAKDFPHDHDLAQALWKEEVRESKIMAGILMPTERFFPEVADIWVEQIPNQEIAELTVMNLFQRLPYASEIAFRWVSDTREIFQVCGLLLLARLCMKGCKFNESASNELLDQAFTALQDKNERIARQAYLLLMKYLTLGEEECKSVSAMLSGITCAENPVLEGRLQVLQMECKPLL